MRRGLAVLIYHRVGSEHDPLRKGMATAAEFRAQMRTLSRFFRPMAIADGLRGLRAGTVPSRAVAVTFDDGYADNVSLALPILKSEGVPATFFIATSYLDGGRMWNDTVIEALRRMPPGEYPFRYGGIDAISVPLDLTERRPLVPRVLNAIKHLPQVDRQDAADTLASLAGSPLPSDLMMRRRDVATLVDAGMEVGGHTRTHPILSGLSYVEAEKEIVGGLDDLASLIGRRPALFAYPNGRRGQDYGDREVSILRRAGIEAAFVTNRGIVRRNCDPLQMPRVSPLHTRATRFGVALWLAYSEPEWLPDSAGVPIGTVNG